jgi:hypothetical protein
MPVVFRQGGFKFFFYSNEGDPREPMHVMCAAQAASRNSGCNRSGRQRRL